MSVLDDLLDDYEAVAEAARRLERSRGTHIGEHEFCCENGRCLKYEESFRRAEADLREALARVNPRSFPSQANQVGDHSSRLERDFALRQAQPEHEGSETGPTEYLLRFLTCLEK